MSTDIGALQKQYAKLQRKQHHACVVISGIRPARSDTDVNLDTDSPGSPKVTGIACGDDHVEGSVAMLTLSVPIETEKSHQDLMDPVSPTVFGETKCFFVQNVKKKETKSSKHLNKSVKRAVPYADGTIQSDSTESIDSGTKSKPYQAEITEDNNNRKDKKVCFSEKVEIMSQHEVKENLSYVNNFKDDDEELQNDIAGQKVGLQNDIAGQKVGLQNDIAGQKVGLQNDIAGQKVGLQNDIAGQKVGLQNDVVGQKAELENEVQDTKDKENHLENENDISEPNDILNDDNGLNDEKECGVSPDILEADTSLEETEQKAATLGAGKKESQNNKKSRHQLLDSNSYELKTARSPNELQSSILKNSRTHGLRNPAIKFSKQYYPSRQVSHKKQRTISESVESTNRQSIYQHFMMTKRQLSLDSALGTERNQATPTKNIDFPFPVHLVNEHKIKAGMKLGLYDQKALEKIEKTRKLPKSKLPNLSFD